MKLYKDKAGNTLHISGKQIFAKNATGEMVNKQGLSKLVKRFGTKLGR